MPFDTPYIFEFAFESTSAIPTMRVRIAFASDPLDATPSWTDVTSDVMSISIRRGRQHELNRMESGTAIVELKNTSFEYYPTNTGSAYYDNMKAMKRISIQGSYDDGTSYKDLYTGYIEAWIPTWKGEGGYGAIMTLRCVDGMKIVGRYRINDAVGYAEEASGTRIGNILDDVGWPAADRDIDTGQVTIIATGAMENINALDHAQKVAESELGLFLVAPNGYMTFHDRAHRTGSSSLAIFGDDSGEDRFRDIKFILDETLLYNEVRATREGGTEQVSTNSSSITAYGRSSLIQTGLLLTSDFLALKHANYMIARYSDIEMRVKEIQLHSAIDPFNTLPKILDLDISDKITCRKNEAVIDGDYFIEGVQHDWTPTVGLITKYALSDANRYLQDPDEQSDILRPNAPGTNTNLTPFPGTGEANWEDVDEATTDEDTTYVWSAVSPRDDYNIENPPYPYGTISKVVITARVREAGVGANFLIETYVGGNNYTDPVSWREAPAAYTNYTWEMTVSPDTSAAWTWAEVNGMEVGIRFVAGTGETRCTQLFATVYYIPSW